MLPTSVSADPYMGPKMLVTRSAGAIRIRVLDRLHFQLTQRTSAMKNIRRILLAAAAVTLISACGSMKGGHSAGMNQPSAAAPKSAMEYVATAASSDMLEIQSSRFVLQRTQNAQVRSFAEQMMRDHPRLSETLMAAARRGGLNPHTPALMPRHADMLNKLASTGPAQMDAAYLAMQVIAHEEALTLHQMYAASGDNTSLRDAATSAVPVVRGHLQHVRGLRP